MTFETSAPESRGISTEYLLSFLDRMEQKKVPMHSFLLYVKDKIVAEGYFHPYTKETLHRMFSISKSFTAVAIGILEQEGRLSLSDTIIRYFPDKVPASIHPWIAEMTIRDMLMMRTCHASTTYKIAKTDWVGSFFHTQPTHKSGTIFHYDTSSSHVLAALVERLSGMPMLDFLKDRLSALDFSKDSYMLTDPEGVSMGGSGLVATTRDMLKFGYLLLNEGCIHGRQLVSKDFLKTATSALTENIVTAPLPSESCGYGYMFWRTEKDGYVCYGMGGQLLMVFPEKELIFITTADTQGIAGGNQLIYDAFYQEIYEKIAMDTPLPLAEASLKTRFSEKVSRLALAPLTPCPEHASWQLTSTTAASIHGKTFRVITPDDDVSGFSSFSFLFPDAEKGTLLFQLSEKSYSLSFGFGQMSTGHFPIYDLFYAASGIWLDSRTLYIRFHIIDEYVGSVHMQFFFGEHDITVFMKKIEESCFQEFNGHFYGVDDNGK